MTEEGELLLGSPTMRNENELDVQQIFFNVEELKTES
jgi:hypothetical protein